MIKRGATVHPLPKVVTVQNQCHLLNKEAVDGKKIRYVAVEFKNPW